ncbi:MAG: HAD family phosphatase [Clostridia bacterium]|nr:HAD family phosphatase [Clostridia bacterium]
MENKELRIGAVIFDQDGVLYDTERVYHEAWIKAGYEFGIPDPPGLANECTGRNIHDIGLIFAQKFGPDFPYEAFMDKRMVYYHEIVRKEGLILKPGVRELLEWLKASQIPASVCTSTPRELTIKQLHDSGLHAFFADIVDGSMVRCGKPDPEIYLLAASRLGVEPVKCIGVEDSYNGVRSIVAAGMRAVMVPDLLKPNDEMKKIAWRIDETLFDFLHMLSGKE